MATISTDFTEAGLSGELTLKPGQSATYDVAGTYTGFVHFERSRNGGASWENVASAEDEAMSGTVINETRGTERFRFRAVDTDGETPITGTAETELADADDTVVELKTPDGRVYARVKDTGVEFPDAVSVAGATSLSGAEAVMPTTSVGVGAKNGATVSAVERGNGVVHQTVLTLASTPVTVANTTGASFGGAKLYDFPAGRILALGVVADLDFNWAGTDIVATGSGDFALGSTITEDATLDGTDVNLLPSTALTDPFVDGVGAAAGALAASAQLDGTTDAIDANINIIIDDADVEDAASDIVLVSGTVTITWINLGDF